jgi:transcriptional regulator with XRE-family HTH domain
MGHEVETRKAIGRRLRVTAWELGYKTQQQLADAIGCTLGQVDTWYNGRALPPVKHMETLCKQHRLTLDWIYRGVSKGLADGLYIRIQSALEFDEPAPFVRREPEPEPEPETEAPGVKKARKRWSVYRRRLAGTQGIVA